MSDVLIVIGAITLLLLLALVGSFIGNTLAKCLLWLWDRR